MEKGSIDDVNGTMNGPGHIQGSDAVSNVKNYPDKLQYHWLLDFRAFLELLWPFLDFSDKVLFQGLQSSSRYQDPLALMNFFRRRGILNLDGLCIFRGDDFWQAQDPDCKPLFESNRFVYSLDKICYFISWRGGNELKQLVLRSINKCSGGLFKIEEAVDEERGFQPASGCRLAGWQLLGIKKMVKMERNIQKSGAFNLLSRRWSLDGFSHFMSFLSKEICIKSGSTTLPLDLMACSANAREGLTQALRTKKLDRLEFHFEMPKRQSFQHGNTLMTKFPAAYSNCFESMVEGFSSPNCSIQELKLENMNLSHIEADYENLGKHNPFNVLFSGDNIAQLQINLKPGDGDDDWDPFACYDYYRRNVRRRGIRVACLKLFGLDIGTKCWKVLWENVSRLEGLECVALDPRSFYENGMDLSHISMALNGACSLPKLSSLHLGDHWCPGTLNVTEVLSNLLMKGVIVDLAFHGSNEGNEYSYEVDMKRFCESLKENGSLKFLKLICVRVFETGSGVARMLMDTMQQSSNTYVCQAKICDDQYYYTSTGVDSWDFDDPQNLMPYENYEDALQLEYLVKLNNSKLCEVKERGATKQHLVSLIAEVHDYFFVEGREEEVSVRRQILDISNDAALDDGLDRLFGKLLASSDLWSGAMNESAEHLGMVYGLLHASPDLWCYADDERNLVEPPSKRPRVC